MEREQFITLVEQVLDSLPEQFQERIHNLAVLVEDQPPEHIARSRNALILGIYQGLPSTKRSVFDMTFGPDRIVLYQRNIETVCSSEAQIRHEVRQTVLHELGHYFGMDEEQLKDV
jgi:predicted Zn-dependent protease with MMP-like domain